MKRPGQSYVTTRDDPDRPGWKITHICPFENCTGNDDPRHGTAGAWSLYLPSQVLTVFVDPDTVDASILPPPGRDVSELVIPDGPANPDPEDDAPRIIEYVGIPTGPANPDPEEPSTPPISWRSSFEAGYRAGFDLGMNPWRESAPTAEDVESAWHDWNAREGRR